MFKVEKKKILGIDWNALYPRSRGHSWIYCSSFSKELRTFRAAYFDSQPRNG